MRILAALLAIIALSSCQKEGQKLLLRESTPSTTIACVDKTCRYPNVDNYFCAKESTVKSTADLYKADKILLNGALAVYPSLNADSVCATCPSSKYDLFFKQSKQYREKHAKDYNSQCWHIFDPDSSTSLCMTAGSSKSFCDHSRAICTEYLETKENKAKYNDPNFFEKYYYSLFSVPEYANPKYSVNEFSGKCELCGGKGSPYGYHKTTGLCQRCLNQESNYNLLMGKFIDWSWINLTNQKKSIKRPKSPGYYQQRYCTFCDKDSSTASYQICNSCSNSSYAFNRKQNQCSSIPDSQKADVYYGHKSDYIKQSGVSKVKCPKDQCFDHKGKKCVKVDMKSTNCVACVTKEDTLIYNSCISAATKEKICKNNKSYNKIYDSNPANYFMSTDGTWCHSSFDKTNCKQAITDGTVFTGSCVDSCLDLGSDHAIDKSGKCVKKAACKDLWVEKTSTNKLPDNMCVKSCDDLFKYSGGHEQWWCYHGNKKTCYNPYLDETTAHASGAYFLVQATKSGMDGKLINNTWSKIGYKPATGTWNCASNDKDKDGYYANIVYKQINNEYYLYSLPENFTTDNYKNYYISYFKNDKYCPYSIVASDGSFATCTTTKPSSDSYNVIQLRIQDSDSKDHDIESNSYVPRGDICFGSQNAGAKYPAVLKSDGYYKCLSVNRNRVPVWEDHNHGNPYCYHALFQDDRADAIFHYSGSSDPYGHCYDRDTSGVHDMCGYITPYILSADKGIAGTGCTDEYTAKCTCYDTAKIKIGDSNWRISYESTQKINKVDAYIARCLVGSNLVTQCWCLYYACKKSGKTEKVCLGNRGDCVWKAEIKNKYY